MSSKGAENLARHVRARRDQLDLTQLEVHAAGGPSNTWQTLIEGGRIEALSRSTARKLDRGLQWEPGSARRIWEGGEPIPLRTDPTAEAVRQSNLSPTAKAAILRMLAEEEPPASEPPAQQDAG